MFDPFFSTKGANGNGLGLSIANGIIRRHGGAIRVESSVGIGTTIVIELPLAPLDASDARWIDRVKEARRLESRPPCQENRRALVVDDDPAVVRVLSEMLRGEGYSVEAAIGGAAAVVQLHMIGEPYSLVVTDLFMPEVNGLDVAAETRRLGATRRLVVMSGCALTLNGGALEGHGIDAVLRKPFSREDLRTVV
jgi:CheY-like chemotaxis protein